MCSKGRKMRRVRAQQTRVKQGTCVEGVGGAKCARCTNRLNADSRRGPRNLDIFRSLGQDITRESLNKGRKEFKRKIKGQPYSMV